MAYRPGRRIGRHGAPERARDLQIPHRALAWTGDKPTTGISAVARAARHRLLADAARESGAAVILMGHTADDRLEAREMRAEGSNVSEPRSWAPSPIWPEGRGVFVLRPLIDVRRKAIRDGLQELVKTWLDDPSNTLKTSLRARVRARISGGGDPGSLAEPPCAGSLHRATTVGWAGDIALSQQALADSSEESRSRYLRAALSSAAGAISTPRGASIALLWRRLSDPGHMAATLAGARIERDGDTVRIMRDDGAMRNVTPAPGDGPVVFDGRFEVDASAAAGVLTSMRGHMSRLGRAEQTIVRTAPPAARRALPVLVDQDGSASCPLIAKPDLPVARGLVAARLAAALGAIPHEDAIGCVGETAFGVLDKSARIERSVHEPA